MSTTQKHSCDLCKEHGSCFLLPENREVYQRWRDGFRMKDEEILTIIPSPDEHRISPLGMVHLTKGHAAFREGDYESAYLFYMQATPVIKYAYPAWTYAAMCLYFLGNIEEAYTCAERAYDVFLGYEKDKGNRFMLHCENLLKEKGKQEKIIEIGEINLSLVDSTIS